MTKTFTAGALAVLLSAAAPGFADTTQLALSAGVSPDAGLSLDTLAALKFNQESDGDERQTVKSSRSMPGGSALDRFAAAHFSRHVRSDERQVVIGYREPVAASAARHAQLIAAAGTGAEAAQGMTIDEIAAAKFARDPGEQAE